MGAAVALLIWWLHMIIVNCAIMWNDFTTEPIFYLSFFSANVISVVMAAFLVTNLVDIDFD